MISGRFGVVCVVGVFALAIVLCSCTSTKTEYIKGEAYIKKKLAENGLPYGGSWAWHPRKPTTLYFTLEKVIYRDPVNAGKFSGLWLTTNECESFKRLGTFQNVGKALVHPETEAFFILAGADTFESYGDGFVREGTQCKLLVSQKGIHWEDITPGREDMVPYRYIFPDPDHPDRICIYDHYEKIHQSMDADYEKWKQYTRQEWEDLHEDYTWDKIHTEGSEIYTLWLEMKPMNSVPE
mgnify:CR=1 FL=1